MTLLSISNAHLAYGHHALLDAAHFSLQPHERVGLIGRNGTGKSSLMRVLAKKEVLDDGDFQQQAGINTVYTLQEPVFPEGLTAFEAVRLGVQPILDLIDRYSESIANGGDADAIDAMQTEIERLDGWNWENRVHRALDLFQVDAQAQVDSLSGGGKKRVALAQGHATNPSVWLLDEPTNHLDVDAIVLLQDVLNAFTGSSVIISHDRSFLDAVCTRIVELDRGALGSYPGNYAQYQILKAEQLEQEAVINAKKDKLLAQEEVWIRQGVQARRTRSQHRVKQLHALREERAVRRNQQGRVKLEVDSGERSGKIVVELEGVEKAFGEKTIATDLSLSIMRGDKVGLVGANGVGKTTLLNMMLGLEPADDGRVKTGSNIQVAYFDQLRNQLDLNVTLEDAISPGSEWIEINGKKQHVKSYLADFLFPPQRAASPVQSLSGGERSRLFLARLFAQPANVLVLDEPTNDLDIDTIELLEELLQDYKGTVFLISHDRRFLNNVVTSIVAHEPLAEKAGTWIEYEGNVEDWMTQRARMLLKQQEQNAANATSAQASNQSTKKTSNTTAAETEKAKEAPATPEPKTKPKRKLSYKEQRELNALPAKIQALEEEQAKLQNIISDGSVFADNPEEATRVTERFGAIEEELLECLERWETLEQQL